MTFPSVQLGEHLQLDLDVEQVDPSVTYEMAGVLSFGKGLFSRESVHGGSTSYRKFYRLRADHVVMSQLFGWEGALALSSPAFEGKYLSPQFPTFTCKPTLDRHYLGYCLQLPSTWDQLAKQAKGMGDRRRTLCPEHLFKITLPLPPLAEQWRIVVRVEAVAARVAEAGRLREEATEHGDRLLIQMAHRADLGEADKTADGWRQVPLGEVLTQVSDPVPVDTSTEYSNLGIYSFARGLFQKPPISGLETSATTLFRVRTGQFIYSRLFAFEGSYGRVTPEFDGHFVSAEYPTFDCAPGHVRSEFLAAYFKAKHVWAAVAVRSKGLGDRRQRVQPKQLLAHRIWLPPLAWQDRIAEAWAKLDALRLLQSESAAELDALLPAVLNRAFAGEL